MYNYNIFNIIVGGERSGKTTFAVKFVRKVNELTGKGAIAYNVANEEDFEGFKEITFLSYRETLNVVSDKRRYKRNPRLLFFKMSGKVYKIQALPGILSSKLVYTHRISEPNFERYLFWFMLQYCGGFQLILDDARVLYRYGINSETIELFNRKNHAGFRLNGRRGVDIHIVFHSIDTINAEMFDFATSMCLFRFNRKPKFKNIEDEELKEVIEQSYEEIKASERYSFIQIFIRGYEKIMFKKFSSDYLG